MIEETRVSAELKHRDKLLGLETADNKNDQSTRQFPMIMKFNPRLPPMSEYVRKYPHVEFYSETDIICISYKMEHSVLSMIPKQ